MFSPIKDTMHVPACMNIHACVVWITSDADPFPI